MTDDEIAARILELVGGPTNLTVITRCFVRLRLVLVDPAVVDVAGIEAIPEVAMTVTQAGQFQIVLGARVRGVHTALHALVDGAA
jgi:phosphotransferase system IIB component